ncbi:MAG: hypothetical protein JF886_04095 [Candidatus Dormibacteraeota bacterium]|uniref:Uncharacterized protein n=3 Tax=Candidatus Aeolococcus gillhamiae TaxID=3127015 RepID=A0A934N585_9BACT|nr:hypothetical protein [Candidatus Dormibacteraeota bacterium]
MADSPGDRAAFAERMRLQVAARYGGTTVDIDPARYSLRVHGPGLDVTLPLATLHRACERQPARTAALIADFVRSVEATMVPRAAESVSLGRVLWCVRSQGYLDSLARSEELLTERVGGDIVAFIAESLPGQVMRGVPRAEWRSAGIGDAAVRRAADDNTATRFSRVLERVAAIERIPADGWRLAGDSLYQGSIVMVPAVLRGLVERSGGDVLIGLPDRAVALIIPAALPAAETFGRRVLQEWREAMNPCSREVLRTDGASFAVLEHGRRAPSLLPWLND